MCVQTVPAVTGPSLPSATSPLDGGEASAAAAPPHPHTPPALGPQPAPPAAAPARADAHVNPSGLGVPTTFIADAMAHLALAAKGGPAAAEAPAQPPQADAPQTPRQVGPASDTASPASPQAADAAATPFEALRKKRSIDKPPRPPAPEDVERRGSSETQRRSTSLSSDRSSIGARSTSSGSSNGPCTPELGSDAEPVRLQVIRGLVFSCALYVS